MVKFSFYDEIKDFIKEKELFFNDSSLEINRNNIITSISKRYEVYDLFDYKIFTINELLQSHMDDLYEQMLFVEEMKQKYGYPCFLFSIKNYGFNYDNIIKLDISMIEFYKQNRKNKAIIKKVKIFTKKRKLCDDIRNLIISYLIVPPKNKI